MDSKNFDSSVYVDTSALSSWQSAINDVNSSCIDNIEQFSNLLNELDDYWQGTSADSFKSSLSSYLKSMEAVHNDLSNISNFLQVVVYTMESE